MKSTIELWQEFCDRIRPVGTAIVCTEVDMKDCDVAFEQGGLGNGLIVCKLSAQRSPEIDQTIRAALIAQRVLKQDPFGMTTVECLMPWTWNDPPSIDFSDVEIRDERGQLLGTGTGTAYFESPVKAKGS